jgi:hypothetical protein
MKKEISMNDAMLSIELALGFEEDDQCPECGHVWTSDQLIHFSDCMYHETEELKAWDTTSK